MAAAEHPPLLPAWAPLSQQQILSYDARGYCHLPKLLDPTAVANITRPCDDHMAEWGPKTQEDFPVNYYANRYTPMFADPALRAIPTHPRVLTAAVQLLRSVVRRQTDAQPSPTPSPEPESERPLLAGYYPQDIKLSHTQLTYKFSQDPTVEPTYPDGDGTTFRNWHRDLNKQVPSRSLSVARDSIEFVVDMAGPTRP